METRLQQLNSRHSKGRESTEEFEEMELEVKQKLQEEGKKRENLGEHTFISYICKYQKQSIPFCIFTYENLFSRDITKCY